jgi:hypothetical protein
MKFLNFFLCLWVILPSWIRIHNTAYLLRFSFYGYHIVCTGRAAVLHYCADWVRVGLHQAHSHQPGEEDIHDCPSSTGLYLYHCTQYPVVAYYGTYQVSSSVSL